MANCSKSTGKNIQLTSRHVPCLLEHLSMYAYKWRDLGVALKFKSQDLRNIEACPSLIATAPCSFMQRLVEEWLEGKYQHTAPPTLANLIKALKSKIVALGTLATQMKDSFDAIVEVFNKFDIITVNENMHVHLKFKADPMIETCNEELVSIGHGSKFHSDIDKPSLCIPKADIDMDGGDKIVQGDEIITIVTLRVNCPQLDQFKESLTSIYLTQPEVPQDTWPPISNKVYINLALVKRQEIDYNEEYIRLTIRGDLDDILHHKEKLEYKDIFVGLRSGSLLLVEGRPGSGKTTFVHKITRDWAASETKGPMRLVLLVSLRVLNSWKKPLTLDDILQLLDLQESLTILKKRKGKGVCFIFDGLDEFSPPEGENSIVYKIINKTYLPQSLVIVASRPAALVKLRQRADRVVEVIGFPRDQIFEYVKNYPFSDTLKAEQLKLYLLFHPNVLHMCYLPIHAAMIAFLFKVMGKVPHTETEIYKHFTRFTIMRSLSKHKGQDELEDMDTGKLDGEEENIFDTICEFALEKTILKKQVLDQDEMKLRLQGKGCKDISLGLVTVDRTAGLYGFKNIYTFLHLTYQEYLAAHHISTLSDEDQLKLIKQYGDTDHMQVVWKFYFGLVKFEGYESKIKALISGKQKNIGLFDIQCAYESQQEIVCNVLVKEINAQIVVDNYLTTTDFTALGYLLANSSLPVSLSLKCQLNDEAVDAILAETGKKPLSLHALHCYARNLRSIRRLLMQQQSLETLVIKQYMSHKQRYLGRSPRYPDNHGISDIVRASLPNLTYNDMQQWMIRFFHESTMLFCSSFEEDTQSPFESLDNYALPNIVEISLVNLIELRLTNVRIGPETLTDVLQFCEELTSLILNHSIDDDCIIPLLKGLSQHKKLKTVSCSTQTTADVIYYTDIRHKRASIRDIGTIDFDTIRSLSDACQQRIESFLHVEGIRENYLQTLLVVIKHRHNLAVHLKKFLPSRLKTFIFHQKLQHHYNIFPIIAECIPDFSALEKFVLTGFDFLHDATHLANMLRSCTMLQEVDLSYGDTFDYTNVLSSLKKCSNLEKLSWNNTDMGNDNASVLASCLQYWPQLLELHLRECSIKEEGARAIAENMTYCTKLTKVDLEGNDIHQALTIESSSIELKCSVQSHTCTKLTKVDLEGNDIHQAPTIESSSIESKCSVQSHTKIKESSSQSHENSCCTLF